MCWLLITAKGTNVNSPMIIRFKLLSRMHVIADNFKKCYMEWIRKVVCDKQHVCHLNHPLFDEKQNSHVFVSEVLIDYFLVLLDSDVERQ